MAKDILNESNFKSSYDLRSRFVSQLQSAGLRENTLDHAFSSAEYMGKSWLLKRLWALSFPESAEWALNSFSLTGYKQQEELYDAVIPSELVIPFRNELRYQYTLVHKDFLKIADNEYARPFGQFIQELGMDKILSAGIFMRIVDFLSKNIWLNSSLVEKTIHLLKSSKINYRYGGLKNIGLRHHEIMALLDKSEAIAALLKKVFEISISKQEVILPSDIFVQEDVDEQSTDVDEDWSTPFAHLDTLVKENNYKLSNFSEQNEQEEEECTSEETPVTNSLKVLTPADVIMHQDVLHEFICVTEKIRSLGFNPKEVLEKLSALHKLLEGFSELSQ